jgi:hypothetical protein
MPKLEELQKQFMTEVYQKQDKTSLPIKSNAIDKNQRLKIYQNNIFTALTSNLKNKYPLVCRFVDERFFNYACDEYIQQHPSSSGNLDNYGNNFAEFLSSFTPTQNIAYLKDLAHLEWLLHLCYSAASEEPKFIAKKEENILQLAPASFILYSEYPIYQLWEIGAEGNSSVPIDLEESEAICIYRTNEYEIQIKQLNEKKEIKRIIKTTTPLSEADIRYLKALF